MLEYLIIAGIIITVAIIILIRTQKTRRKSDISYEYFIVDLKDISINDIDMMIDGKLFEEYVTRVLQEVGYTDAYTTVGSGDYGADVVFTDRAGQRNIIQAKRYDVDNPVNLEAVQQVYTAKNYYQAKKTIVITSSTYRESAETLAGVNGVLLLDRQDITQIIENLRKNEYEKVRSTFEREPRIIYEFWDDPIPVRLKELK